MITPVKSRGTTSRTPIVLVFVLLLISFVCIVLFSLMPAPQTPAHPLKLFPAPSAEVELVSVSVSQQQPPVLDEVTETSVSWWGGTIFRPLPRPLDPATYPRYLKLADVVKGWNPDLPDPPRVFRETLQHFNYSNPAERAMAVEYRNAELPFKVYNVPDFDRTAARWTDAYLSDEFGKLGSVHVEKSVNNHFMYWSLKNGRDSTGYTPPTEILHGMTFDEWLQVALEADRSKMSNATEHLYLMSSSAPGDRGRSFIARDLKKFSTASANFFITNPNANKGIQCRLAMRGVISEAHYDSGRNMVLMLHGVKRYILNPPTACKDLKLIRDVDHPSYRHSIIDWSDPAQADKYGFSAVDAIDTLVRAGEVLYIPSFWNHYIIALMYSTQCNSRSGSPPNEEGLLEIQKCMGVVKHNKLRKRKGS